MGGGGGSYHKYETQKSAIPDLLSPPSKDTMMWGIEGMVEVPNICNRAGYSHDLTQGQEPESSYWWLIGGSY